MKEDEINECNKQIALMLGWTYVTWQEDEEKKYGDNIKAGWWVKIPKNYHPKIHRNLYKGRSVKEINFRHDWDILMEALEFIRNQDWRYDMYASGENDFECNLWFELTTEIEGRSKNSLKEAIYSAVSQFSKLFNVKK